MLKEMKQDVGTLTEKIDGVQADIVEFKLDVNKRFKSVDARFDEVDKRFESVDVRFNEIDNHFETVNVRLELMDIRFESIEHHLKSMDKRFDKQDSRFDTLEEKLDNVTTEMRSYFKCVEKRADTHEYVLQRLTFKDIVHDGEIEEIKEKLGMYKYDHYFNYIEKTSNPQ